MTETDPKSEQLAAKAGVQLRQYELDVSPEVAQRLQAARRLAVDEAEDSLHNQISWWPKIASAGAALSVAVVMAVGVMVYLQAPLGTLPRMDEAEMAAAQEVELLEELEFVAWMVAMEEADDLPNSG